MYRLQVSVEMIYFISLIDYVLMVDLDLGILVCEGYTLLMGCKVLPLIAMF